MSTLEQLMREQQSGLGSQVVEQRKTLRVALRSDHLIPLRQIARVLQKNVPGFPKLINLTSNPRSEEQLVAVARAAAEDLQPYEALFVERGMPDDFLAQLVAATDAVVGARAQFDAFRAQRVKATEGIGQALSRAGDAVVCLKPLVKRECVKDPVNGPETLRAFESAVRAFRIPVSPLGGMVGESGAPLSSAEGQSNAA